MVRAAYARKHLIGGSLTVSEGLSMADSMATGRHGAEAVAESSRVTDKQKPSELTGNDVGFLNLKSHPQ